MLIKFLTLFIIMLFLHVIADYNLQGILASMKQKSWWKKQSDQDIDDTIYKNDYKMALFMHAFSWSFIINLPFLYYKANLFFIISVAINTVIHFFIDDLKANKLKINLVEDQELHMLQMMITIIVYLCLYK